VQQFGEHVQQVRPVGSLRQQRGSPQGMQDCRGTDAAALQTVGFIQIFKHMQEGMPLHLPVHGHTVGNDTQDIFPADTLRRQLHVQRCGQPQKISQIMQCHKNPCRFPFCSEWGCRER